MDWHKMIRFLYQEVLVFVFGALAAEIISYSVGLGDWFDALFRNRLVGLSFIVLCTLIGVLYRRSVKQQKAKV